MDKKETDVNSKVDEVQIHYTDLNERVQEVVISGNPSGRYGCNGSGYRECDD